MYIVSAPGHFQDIAQLTDDQGRFTISASIPGHYSVGVRSDEWGSAQADVKIIDDGSVALEVRLNPLKEQTK